MNDEPPHFKDDELELSRFKEIWKKTIKTPLSNEQMYSLYHSICDEKLEFVQFEKFNRLCDLFFFTPGKVLKQKNDSHQLYLIMSSMQNDKAGILTKKVSSNYLTIIYREKHPKPKPRQKETEQLSNFLTDLCKNSTKSATLSAILIEITTTKFPTKNLDWFVKKWTSATPKKSFKSSSATQTTTVVAPSVTSSSPNFSTRKDEELTPTCTMREKRTRWKSSKSVNNSSILRGSRAKIKIQQSNKSKNCKNALHKSQRNINLRK